MFSNPTRSWLAPLWPLLLLASSSCGDPPMAPTPPPALTVSCPDSMTLASTTGGPMTVHYVPPTSTGGVPPVQIPCTPANDSTFAPGSTPVICIASDTKGTVTSCSFNVTVTIPPKLQFTSFRAFGDSITEGEVPSEGDGFRALKIDKGVAYPHELQDLLLAQYGSFSGLNVLNDGCRGESTAEGLSRLMGQSAQHCLDDGIPAIPIASYPVILMMEGTNDLPAGREAIVPALQNLERMVQFAQANKVRAYLGTVAPMSHNITMGCPDRSGALELAPPYNDGVRSIAARNGVTLVDVYNALSTNLGLYIDCDGLHPTPAGYHRIAQEFFKAIQQTLQTNGTRTFTFGAVGPLGVDPRALARTPRHR